MTEPINSKYDPDPFDPDDRSHDDDSPPDLGNTDSPELKVAWETRPSFNKDPKDIGSSGGGEDGSGSTKGGDAADFSVEFKTLGDQVNSMLGKARVLVNQYESLRTNVLATKGVVFGQTSVHPGGKKSTYDSYSKTWTTHDTEESPTVFAEPAREFADQMNPAQEKTLQSIGATLELLGEYIALVNHSGQAYAAADRQSLFPSPPSKGVTG